jgi:hypothetical protein
VFDDCSQLPPLEARTGGVHLDRCWLDASVKAAYGGGAREEQYG